MSETLIDPTGNLSAQTFFNTKVRESLRTTCGGCHERDGGVGPPFMKSTISPGFDCYLTIATWNNFVTPDPDLSALLKKGQHEGPALAGASTKTDQYDLVRQWLVKEAEESTRSVFKPFKPQFKPFYPIADGVTENKRDLGEINPLLEGAYLSFKATRLARGIEISNLKFFNIKASATGTKEQRTIRFVRPLFVVWKNGTPSPDPVDNFASLDKTTRVFGDDDDKNATTRNIPGTGNTLPPGLFTLSEWRTGDAISVTFDILDLLPPIQGENPCTAAGLSKFRDIAPFLAKMQGQGNCATRSGCHNATDSNGSLDLSPALTPGTAGAEPAAFKALCERVKYYNQTRGFINNTIPSSTSDAALLMLQTNHARVRFQYSAANCTDLGFTNPAGDTCHKTFRDAVDAMRAIDP